MLIWWSRANIFMWDVNYGDKLRQRTLCSTQMTPWWLLDNLFHVFDHFRPPRLKTPLAEPQNRKCRSKYCTYDKLHDVSFQKHPKLSPNSSWAPRSRLSKIFFFVPQKKYPRRTWPRPLKQTRNYADIALGGASRTILPNITRSSSESRTVLKQCLLSCTLDLWSSHLISDP